MGHDLLYLMFAAGMMVVATGVIFTRTPIHGLLLLIVTFFNAAGLFLVWGAEFLAMLLVIVYVGAVAVLFLFVVMMLDVDAEKLKFGFSKYMGLSAFLCLVLFAELIVLVLPWQTWAKSIDVIAFPIPESVTNIHAIGGVLYTNYFYVFQMSGIMLFVAMVGAILLIAKEKREIARQNVSEQLKRSPANTLVTRKVNFREGVEL